MKEQALRAIWKVALAVTVLADLAFFIFLGLFSGWFGLGDLVQLPPEQTFVLMLVSLVVGIVAFLAGIFAYGAMKAIATRT